jgi:hypothetical protein
LKGRAPFGKRLLTSRELRRASKIGRDGVLRVNLSRAGGAYPSAIPDGRLLRMGSTVRQTGKAILAVSVVPGL